MRPIDLTGQKFGRLTVLKAVPSLNGRSRCVCRCECGNLKVARAHDLRAGLTRSCGCLRAENIRARGSHGIKGAQLKWRTYSPERVAEIQARLTGSLRKIRREERARKLFGLPQKTRYKVQLMPRAEQVRRVKLKSFGYIFAENGIDCYYTPDLHRHRGMEQHCTVIRVHPASEMKQQ